MANASLHVCGNELGADLAQYIHEQETAALARHGRFVVALSGGSMPKVLGAALTGESAPSFDWAAWHIFFADERCVPLDHDDSNFKACEQALFGKVPIPAANLHPLQHEPADVGNPQPAAARYEAELRTVFPDVGADALPELDLILLGMGPDGHTASLFPSHPLLSFDSAWVAAIADSPKPPPSRVTLTLPVINAARGVAFVTTGASKADALGAIFGSGDQPCQLPSALVRCQGGAAPVHWFVDAAAASSVPASTTASPAARSGRRSSDISGLAVPSEQELAQAFKGTLLKKGRLGSALKWFEAIEEARALFWWDSQEKREASATGKIKGSVDLTEVRVVPDDNIGTNGVFRLVASSGASPAKKERVIMELKAVDTAAGGGKSAKPAPLRALEWVERLSQLQHAAGVDSELQLGGAMAAAAGVARAKTGGAATSVSSRSAARVESEYFEEGIGDGGLPWLHARHPSGSELTVYPFGATVTSLKSAGGREMLFTSSTAVWDGSKPIRGGVPIAFPQFASGPGTSGVSIAEGQELPQHGFARNSTWRLVSKRRRPTDGVLEIILELGPQDISDAARVAWPHNFACRYVIELGSGKANGDVHFPTPLFISTLHVEHPASSTVADWSFQALLHTYFAVDNIATLRIHGFEGSDYLDKLVEGAAPIADSVAVRAIEKETDQIYSGLSTPECAFALEGATSGADVSIHRSASGGASDCVLWNPWVEKSKRMGDFDDDGFRRMVCIEPGLEVMPGRAHALRKGESAWLRQQIDLISNTSNL